MVLELLASSVTGIGPGIWDWATRHDLSMATVLAAGPVLGLITGVLWRRGWHEAAAAVDPTYSLEDRIVSAFDFLRRPQATPLHEPEVSDARAHLSTHNPGEVAPFRIPRALPYACRVLAVALVLLVWRLGPRKGVVAGVVGQTSFRVVRR